MLRTTPEENKTMSETNEHAHLKYPVLGRVRSKAACDKRAAQLLADGHKIVYAFAHVVTSPGHWQYGYLLRDGIPLNGPQPDVYYLPSQNWNSGQAY